MMYFMVRFHAPLGQILIISEEKMSYNPATLEHYLNPDVFDVSIINVRHKTPGQLLSTVDQEANLLLSHIVNRKREKELKFRGSLVDDIDYRMLRRLVERFPDLILRLVVATPKKEGTDFDPNLPCSMTLIMKKADIPQSIFMK